jgi:hypothetical protein
MYLARSVRPSWVSTEETATIRPVPLPVDEPRPRRRRRVIDNGQVMLTANLFVAVEDGQEHLRLLRDGDEFEKVVSTYWG